MNLLKLNRKDTATAFAVNVRTVTRWYESGMPRNGDKSFNLPACISWRHDQIKEGMEDILPEAETEESKKWLAEYRKQRALIAEIERKKLEGTVIETAEVERDAFNIGRAVRDSLLNIPDRISAILAAETDESKVSEFLTKEIRQALEVLSK